MTKYKLEWDKIYDVRRLFTTETDDEGKVIIYLAEFYDKEVAEYCLEQLNRREQLNKITTRINKLEADTNEMKGNVNILVIDKFLSDIAKLVGKMEYPDFYGKEVICDVCGRTSAPGCRRTCRRCANKAIQQVMKDHKETFQKLADNKVDT